MQYNTMALEIKQLQVSADDVEILHGVDLEIPAGEVHVIMGPNGSGKSTLANSLMGHPKYTVTGGTISVDGEEVTESSPQERAQAGMFLSMQYPPEIAGVTVANFLRSAKSALTGEKLHPVKFYQELQKKMEAFGMDKEFAKRSINVGFSGGEKKRMEILQLLVLDPKYAILDETDSGLDVDALKVVAEGIDQFAGEDKGVLLITHYTRILDYLNPTHVHVMRDGKIVKSGGPELAKQIEDNGYDAL